MDEQNLALNTPAEVIPKITDQQGREYLLPDTSISAEEKGKLNEVLTQIYQELGYAIIDRTQE